MKGAGEGFRLQLVVSGNLFAELTAFAAGDAIVGSA